MGTKPGRFGRKQAEQSKKTLVEVWETTGESRWGSDTSTRSHHAGSRILMNTRQTDQTCYPKRKLPSLAMNRGAHGLMEHADPSRVLGS